MGLPLKNLAKGRKMFYATRTIQEIKQIVKKKLKVIRITFLVST